MNRLLLRAALMERGALRYTPAGLPALDVALRHESQGIEAGMPRRIALELRAVAIGDIAQRIGALALGSEATFEGFISAQRNGRGVVFHLTALQAPQDPSVN